MDITELIEKCKNNISHIIRISDHWYIEGWKGNPISVDYSPFNDNRIPVNSKDRNFLIALEDFYKQLDHE